MGRVYKAHDTRLGRDVALKVIRKEKLNAPARPRRASTRRSRRSAKMKHPNVVEVFDADQVGDTHFFVMEFDRRHRPDEARPRARAAAGPRGVRVHPPGGARPAARPRDGAGPPRHQAVEHPRVAERAGGEARRPGAGAG